MKKYIFISLLLTLLTLYSFSVAQEIPLNKKWLHIYAPEGVTEFHAIPYDSIADFTFVNNVVLVPDSCERDSVPVDDLFEADGFNEMRINYKNGKDTLSLPIENIDHFDISRDLPVIEINLDDYPEVEELWDKELYLNATVNIDGAGEFEDEMGWETKIKGRGNTTWGFPKKPYRFKASKKVSLFGMKKAKSYALLANYIDASHMRNFVALRLAQMLNIPFSNSIIPCRVKLNNVDKGLYFLTEKIGIGGASVDIDEEKGWLFELDGHMDEDYCYMSEPYSLPVMVKDPDLTEIYPDDPDAQWELMKSDFNTTLDSLKNCTDESWRDLIDEESLINYLIVFNVAHNMEIRAPRSVYMYKDSPEGKYYFGPVWDFDWAYNYVYLNENQDFDFPLLHPSGYPGTIFFYDLCHLPGMSSKLIERWDEMVETIYPQLLQEMDEYAKKIKAAAISDGLLWCDKSEMGVSSSFEFDLQYNILRTWINNRIEAAAEHPARLFYFVEGYRW